MLCSICSALSRGESEFGVGRRRAAHRTQADYLRSVCARLRLCVPDRGKGGELTAKKAAPVSGNAELGTARGALRALSRQVQAQLELRRNLKRLAESLAARAGAEQERERTLQELKAALANIRTLEGLLPICLSCKKIHDQKGDWQPFEYYKSAL